MAINIEKQGQRVYLTGDTFAAKDRIKSMGGHWDGDKRAWWVGAKKLAEAEALVAELDPAGAAGLRSDTPAGIVADVLEEKGQGEAAAAVRAAGDLGAPVKAPREDPDNIRLTGKGRYKGREYYAGSITRDGLKVRLLTLPDAKGDYLDFWAPCSEVEEVRRYEPREVWDGRRYSGKTRTVYTTLGNIAAFIAKQRRAEANGEPACAACGKRGELVHDLEDGGMKCRGCCDMPE